MSEGLARADSSVHGRTMVEKLSRVVRCVRLERNLRGRDLVVGDLHGHRRLLERALEAADFDPTRDRVLSVGDLVDRGPESLATLALIQEPWFHAVLGNHELMLLNFLHYFDSRLHSRRAYSNGVGAWIHEAIAKHRKLVLELAERVAQLPLALHVDAEIPFNVMHGDLEIMDSRQDRLFSDPTICIHKADVCASSRQNVASAQRSVLQPLRFAGQPALVSSTPFGCMDLTYVGHSPLRHVTIHKSYVYIEQGTGTGTSQSAGPRLPTLLEHRKFAAWLDSAAKPYGTVSQSLRRNPALRSKSRVLAEAA